MEIRDVLFTRNFLHPNVAFLTQVMIFLIEGVLPESYFANNLRGLSVDMAVFRDLLRLRLTSLSKHLEQLQADARDSSTGKDSLPAPRPFTSPRQSHRAEIQIKILPYRALLSLINTEFGSICHKEKMLFFMAYLWSAFCRV